SDGKVMRWFLDDDVPLPTADEHGRFRISGLCPGAHEIIAARDGYAPARASVELWEGRAVTEVDLRLAAAASLLVRVLTEEGRPCEGATALVIPADEVSGKASVEALLSWLALPRVEDSGDIADGILGSIRSSAEGSPEGLQFGSLRAGAVHVVVRAPGCAPSVRRAVVLEVGAPTELEVRLGPEQVLRGAVSSGSCPPSRIRLRPRGVNHPPVEVEARIDRDKSSFEVGGLGGGPYDLEVDFRTHTAMLVPKVVLHDVRPSDARITVSGRSAAWVDIALLGSDGRPVGGANLMATVRVSVGGEDLEGFTETAGSESLSVEVDTAATRLVLEIVGPYEPVELDLPELSADARVRLEAKLVPTGK
ncbi:carboxypeptidase-like regulatory domain-containing protein, partial [Planctomycetota bacterium]